MNKKFFRKKIGLMALSVLCGTFTYAQDTLRLDLQTAIKIALSDNPTIQVAQQEISRKEDAKKETVSGLYPTVSASASYQRTLKKQVMYMGGGSGSSFTDMLMEPLVALTKPLYDQLGIPMPDLTGGGQSTSNSSDSGISVGLDNNWNAGFNLSLPLYAPTLYKAIKISALDIKLAVETARSSKLSMVNQVTKTYYQLMLSQDSHQVLQISYDQAVANYENIKRKFEQGLVSEYDKIRAEVQVRNLKPGLVQSENAVNLTLLQLKVLMGIDVNELVAIVGDLKDYEDQMLIDVLSANIDKRNNTSLKQLALQKDMLEETLKMTKASYLPSMALSGNYTYISMNDDFKFGNYKWNPYSMIGLSINIPIVQINNIYKVRQNRIQIAQVDYNRENLERNLDLQINNYLFSMRNFVEQMESNKEGIRQAEKGRMIAQKRYEVGSGTILEINDAEVALTTSRLAYYQTIFDFISAKADLDNVLGKGLNAE